ncbi:MAG: YebC/PmpR family DNA-binding transcriptional regulator [Patescibacteria group bacterium]
MSGHSKWSKVKHQKATTDAVKSRAFTWASRALSVSVREGGGMTDPDKNFHLRLAIEQARAVNMPKDTIERAIERASGAGATSYENLLYEGYGPGGVAYLVEAATDNHQRTASEVKHEFEHVGGSLATPGAVSYQFRHSGVVVVSKAGQTFDTMFEVALEAGADDVIERDDVFEIYTRGSVLPQVKHYLETSGQTVEHAGFIMKTGNPVEPSDDVRQKNEHLVEALESLEDVQNVYTTMA